MKSRVSVDGDAESGWMVDIHDGVRHGVYSPSAADAHEALDKAWAEHAQAGTQQSAASGPDLATKADLDALTERFNDYVSHANAAFISVCRDLNDMQDTVRALSTPASPPPSAGPAGYDAGSGQMDQRDPMSGADEMKDPAGTGTGTGLQQSIYTQPAGWQGEQRATEVAQQQGTSEA